MAEQRATSEDLLDALKVEQQGPKEVALPSEKREASWRQQMEEELSKISYTLATLADSIEAKPPESVSDIARPEQDWLANLPQEPVARLTTLEERKSALQQRRRELQQRNRELRIVLRDCNREISYTRRALPDTGVGTQGRSVQEIEKIIVVPDLLANDEATEQQDDTLVEPQETLSLDVFTGILQEDFERELLRLIFRENGMPSNESIRLVLGTRFQHVVQDEINERAQSALQDDLLYEEDGRLVVTEEFVDDLRLFLNDRAIPSRRV